MFFFFFTFMEFTGVYGEGDEMERVGIFSFLILVCTLEYFAPMWRGISVRPARARSLDRSLYYCLLCTCTLH